MKHHEKFAIAFCSMILAACGASSGNDTEIVYTNLLSNIGTNELATDIDVNTKLAEAADSVSYSLNKLAQMKLTEEAKTSKKAHDSGFDAIPNMNKRSSVEWNGPIAPIVEKIAQASKHKFTAIGRTPVVPIIVNLNMKNVTLADILQNVAYQSAGHSRIQFNEKHNAIELRYLDK